VKAPSRSSAAIGTSQHAIRPPEPVATAIYRTRPNTVSTVVTVCATR
jgi:hypothetical protein